MSDPILSFYLRRELHTHKGYVLDFCFNDISSWTDGTLECKHDYIQWFFPLDVPSSCNNRAPVISSHEINHFRKTPSLRKQQLIAYRRMLKFYGLTTWFGGIYKTFKFRDRVGEWTDPSGGTNHNYMRLTRMINSMMLLGNTKEARALVKFLLKLHNTTSIIFPTKTIEIWTHAYAILGK